MPRVEMLLYHGLAPTGMIEISTTSNTGPWTELWLTSTQTVYDALVEWTALATAAEPAITWSFAVGPFVPDIMECVFSAQDGDAWVRLSATLADLLGFSDTVLEIGDSGGNGAINDEAILGVLQPSIGTDFPTDVESAELADYRAARASVLHYGRVAEVTVDLIIPSPLLAVVEDSPLLGGHCAMRVVIDNEDDFGEADLDGALTVYPLEEVTREQESEDDAMWLRLRCATRDPGAAADSDAPGDTADSLWRKNAGATPYGYGLYYAALVEGIPTAFFEVVADASNPTGRDIDATLVIDRSARLGCVADDAPIGKGFDLDLRLLDSATVRAYMTRPERTSRLTAEFTPGDTEMYLDSTTPFTDVSEVYIGTSHLTFTNAYTGQLTGVAALGSDRERSYPVGTIVTDSPSIWQGREVRVYAFALDPMGRYTEPVITDNPMVWHGTIASRPVRDGTEWSLRVRDQVRRPADPLGVSASGTAVWTEDDDPLVVVPVAFTYSVTADLQPTSNLVLDHVQVRPFAAYSNGDTARASVLREAIADAMNGAATDAQVTNFFWLKSNLPYGAQAPGYTRWDLWVELSPAATDTQFEVLISHVSNGGGIFYARLFVVDQVTPVDGSAAGEIRNLQLVQEFRAAGGVALAVILDEGDPALLPTEGMVILEAGGKVDYARYTSLTVDALDPSKVHLALEQRDQILGQELSAILAGDRASVSVRFLWSDEGTLPDIMRRALTSTGDAQHGAFDTLPKGQGYGLPMIDDDSFDAVFAGEFDDLNFQVYVDSGTSFAEIFGGLLQLSRKAIVTRRNAAGTECQIAAVNVGSVDTGVPVVTITDDMLVTSQGRRPIRVKSTFDVPQTIAVTCRTAPSDDVPAGEALITFRDPHLTDWTNEVWDLDIYGVTREAIRRIAEGWALSIFRSGENRQVFEIDVPPSVDAQAGDVALVDVTDPSLWDYADGTPGLTGLVRVLGDPMPLASGLKTLTVAADGIFTAGPMSPSIGIFAVNGGATTPTSLDMAEEMYDLLLAAKDGEASWRVVCYLPGEDGGRAEYTISNVTLTGGYARLTVTAYPSAPSVTLTTDYLLTWTIAGNCTTNQGRYLHNTDGTQWS